MLTEPTTEKLKAMRLEGMMAAWREQQAQPQVASLSFDERLGLLIDAEWLHRENLRLAILRRLPDNPPPLPRVPFQGRRRPMRQAASVRRRRT